MRLAFIKLYTFATQSNGERTVVGKKLNEAVEVLSNEARHHTKLALAKQSDYENGFAQGFAEALRIAYNIQQREN